MTAREGCHYCGTTERELRPYGPGGSPLCFPCMTASPEREQAAKNTFGALVDANEAISPTGVVTIGGFTTEEAEQGPRPFVLPRESRDD